MGTEKGMEVSMGIRMKMGTGGGGDGGEDGDREGSDSRNRDGRNGRKRNNSGILLSDTHPTTKLTHHTP